jgi:hypothetical protein
MEKFILKCTCSFLLITSGLNEEDFKDIYEFPNSCKNCGNKRKFRCPKCGKQLRLLSLQE